MKTEIFRVFHGYLKKEGVYLLKDFSYLFYSGEISCFLSSDTGDIQAVLQLLKGKEVPCFIVDDRSLAESMNVYENLFILKHRNRRNIFRTFPRKLALHESIALLQEYDLKIDPMKKVKNCSMYERYMLSLLQAKLQDTPLVALNMAQIALNTEQLHALLKVVGDLKKMGKGIILLGTWPDEFLSVVDRAVILKNGFIQKIFYGNEISVSVIRKSMEGKIDIRKLHRQKISQEPEMLQAFTEEGQSLFSLKKGEIVGVWDYSWRFEESIINYIRNFLDKNHCFFQYQGCRIFADTPESLWNSQFRLSVVPHAFLKNFFEKLTIEENLIMPIYPRISHCFGTIRKKIPTVLQKEFFEEFQILKTKKWVHQLTNSEKVLLMIFRSMLSNPQILLSESPNAHLDEIGQKKMYRFLKTRPQCIFVFFSSDYEFLKKMCDKIIVNQRGRYQDYQKIKDGESV